MKISKKQQGFTIVELLIVIVVIGILAALVITTFSGIQQKARNTERQTDIKTLQGVLETYKVQSESYPTLANLNDGTWRSANMKGLEDGALQDPQGTAPTLVASPAATSYAYDVTTDAGAACDNLATATNCTKYTLTATLEGGGTYVKTSLN